MNGTGDEVERLRTALARALRYAEVSRTQARRYEHAMRAWERAARRSIVGVYIAGCLAVLGVVLALVSLGVHW